MFVRVCASIIHLLPSTASLRWIFFLWFFKDIDLSDGKMLAHVFVSSDLESLPSAEAMSFACLFLGNMCVS
jgi:hypothetical protein